MHKKRTITAVVTSSVAFLVAVLLGGSMSLFDMDTVLLQGAISNWDAYNTTIDTTIITDNTIVTDTTNIVEEDTSSVDSTTSTDTTSISEVSEDTTDAIDITNSIVSDTAEIDSIEYTTHENTFDDTNIFEKEADTFTTQFQEKTCPFTASIDERVIHFNRATQLPTTLQKGVYTITLASYYVEHTTNIVHIPWRITLLDVEKNVIFESNTARGARRDEALAIERVNTEVSIPKTVYSVQALPIGGDFGNTKPLCASLKRVRKLETMYTTADIQEQFETMKASSTETFEERRDAMLSQYEHTNIDSIDTGLHTKVNTERTDVNQETGVLQEYIEVHPQSIGVRIQTETITVAKQIAETRAHIIKEIKEESLFDALQEDRDNVRTRVREKITQLENEKNDTNATFSETVEHVIVSQKDTQRKEANDSKAVFQSFRLKKRATYEHTTDTDGDGITDYDETYLYETDPENPFTGGSALTDGERLLLGLNPIEGEYSPVTLESPKTTGTVLSDMFEVKDIAYTQDDPGDLTYIPERNVQITGQVQPFSFVTLYIYSTPIVVTVRSDEAGKFEYTLNKTLEDGSHELYVATVNNSGKILARSDAIPFVQTAEAIEYTPASVSKIDGPIDDAMQTLIILALILLLLIGLGVTVILGYIKTQHSEDEKPQAIEHE
jgi:hypothetical protein